MAINKVTYQGNVLIDISDTTSKAEDVLENKVFYDKNGEQKIGILHQYLKELNLLVMGVETIDDFSLESDNTDLIISGVPIIRKGFMQGNNYFKNVIIKDPSKLYDSIDITTEAFKNSSIQNIDLTDVGNIFLYDECLANCSQLNKIEFRDYNSKVIFMNINSNEHKSCFTGCTNLKKTTINGEGYDNCLLFPNVQILPSKIFYDLTNVKSVGIFNNKYAIQIKEGAFKRSDNGNWINVQLQGEVDLTQIPSGQRDYIFNNITNLYLNQKAIYSSNFRNSLKNYNGTIYFGKSVDYVGASLFNSSVKKIILQGSQYLTNIGGFTESDNSNGSNFPSMASSYNLQSFDARESYVSVLEDCTFSYCQQLKSASFRYGYIQAIGDECFDNCILLDGFDFSGTTLIGTNAFRNTGLTTIEVGSNTYATIRIQSGAFAGCKKLKEAIFHNREGLQFGSEIFNGSDTKLIIKFKGNLKRDDYGQPLFPEIVQDSFSDYAIQVPTQWIVALEQYQSGPWYAMYRNRQLTGNSTLD